MKNVDYSKPEVPVDYKCENCGATNCKLWREYQSFDPSLLCASCAAADTTKPINIDSIDVNGMRDSDCGKTDQLGWYVPAVPDEEGHGYWGYCAVPQAGCDWWKHLPTLPTSEWWKKVTLPLA